MAANSNDAFTKDDPTRRAIPSHQFNHITPRFFVSKPNLASSRSKQRKLLPRQGQFSIAAVKLPGWRRSLTSTYGRLERFCAFNGTTFISNKTLADEQEMDISTAGRHVRGLIDCGAVLALYGQRTNCPGHQFNGITRWLLTMGPFFGKGFSTALKQAEGTLSFFSSSPLTIKDNVPSNLWRFIANQEAFYPGSTKCVVEAFYHETSLIPDDVEFSGEFDEKFFENLVAVFCSEDIRKIAYRSVPCPSDTGTTAPARAQVPDAGDPSSEIQIPIPGEKIELSAVSGSAAGGAIAKTDDPGDYESGSPEDAPFVREHIRIRRLAYYYPEEFYIMWDLFPAEPPTTWTPNEARRIRRQLDSQQLTIMHLKLLQDYTPENRKHLITIENFFSLSARDILLQRAARSFRDRELACFGQWNYGARMDYHTVVTNFTQFSYKYQDPEGFNEILAGTMTEFPGGEPEATDWAGHVAYIIHAKWNELPEGFRPFIDVFTGIRNAAPILLAEAAKDPLAWRAMLRLGQMLGADQFKAAYHFSIDELKAAVTARCEWLFNRACQLENWIFVNDVADPDLDSERAMIPNALRYEISNFKHLLEEKFDY